MAQPASNSLITFPNDYNNKHAFADDPRSDDLAFMVDTATQIKLRDFNTAQSATDQLAQAVAADPSNLIVHTRRIYLHFQQGDHEGLYSALKDLFLVLGQRGLPIRSRLLHGARLHLTAPHYQALEACLGENRGWVESDLPAATQSLMCDGVEGHFKLVTLTDASDKEARDPLTDAREFIEFSQIEQARDLLEKGVLEQPEREDLQQELLSLYRASRDQDSFLAMRANLERILDTLPQCWLTFSIH